MTKRVGIRLVDENNDGYWYIWGDDDTATWERLGCIEEPDCLAAWPADRELRWCEVPMVLTDMRGRKAALCLAPHDAKQLDPSWLQDGTFMPSLHRPIAPRVHGSVAWATEDGVVVARVEEVPDGNG